MSLVADWTERDEEIARVLELVAGTKQLPVLAIFPASNPEQPIVIKGSYTKGSLLERLREAGPSKGVTEDGRVAVRPSE